MKTAKRKINWNKDNVGFGPDFEIIPLLYSLFSPRFNPFINHSSYSRSRAVGRSSGFHCNAIRSQYRNPVLSSPLMFAAKISRLVLGSGAKSFQLPTNLIPKKKS